MEHLFQRVGRYCFQGHTHIPGIITAGFEHHTPAELNCEYHLSDEKLMLNVGSVGQPRDHDPRACYLVLDVDSNAPVGECAMVLGKAIGLPSVAFRRVPYGYETTIRKIKELLP